MDILLTFRSKVVSEQPSHATRVCESIVVIEVVFPICAPHGGFEDVLLAVEKVVEDINVKVSRIGQARSLHDTVSGVWCG